MQKMIEILIQNEYINQSKVYIIWISRTHEILLMLYHITVMLHIMNYILHDKARLLLNTQQFNASYIHLIL